MSLAVPHVGHVNHPDGPVVHAVERVVGLAVNVMRYVMIAVFAGVVGLSIFLAVMTNRSHNDTAEVFGHSMFIVESGSMAPAIGVGDAVLVKPLDTAQRATLAVGDIVTFHAADNPDMHITHRVTGVSATAEGVFYRTKGDANPDVDPFQVASEQVFGRVEHRLPMAGYVLHLVQQPRFIVTVLAALLLSHLSVLIWRHAKSHGHLGLVGLHDADHARDLIHEFNTGGQS
jgi:signal peptidase